MRRAASCGLALLCLLGGAARAQEGASPPAQGPRLTKAPALVTFVEAPYPPQERAEGRQASVLLELVVGEDGLVREAKVVESGGAAFDVAALEAAKGFVFSPAEVEGVPTAIRLRYQYDFVLKVEEPAPAVVPPSLGGRVIEQGTGAPLEGVKVRAGAQVATTDAQGRFEFGELPEGEVEVSLEGEGIAPLFGAEVVKAGERLEVTYEVPKRTAPTTPGVLMEIVVTAPRGRREAVSTKVDAGQARSVPGAGGDVVRVVESLPGVARAGAGQGNLIVWGAAPEDTRVYVDGVPLPRLYHESGVRAVIHPRFVQSVELIPGAWGAAYGRGLGGLVLVETQAPTQEGLGGAVGVDLYDASAALGYLGPEGGSVGASARYGLLDRVGGLVSQDAQAFVPLPQYWDGQVRAGQRWLDGRSLDVVAVGAGDRLSRGVPNPDPALETQESRALDFARLYARYEDDQGAQGRTLLVPWVGVERRSRVDRYGAVTTEARAEGWSAGLRAQRRQQPQAWLSLEYGLDVEAALQRHERGGSLALPAREGDARVFGQPPPDQRTSDAYEVASLGVAPWLEARAAWFGERLRLVPGLRLDSNLRSASRRIPPTSTLPEVGLYRFDPALEPRLALEGEPWGPLTLRAAAGVYRQLPPPAELSARFGNPDLPPSRGQHALVGFAWRAPWELELEVTGFVSRTELLPARSQRETPVLAQALEPTGQGQAQGLQALLRLRPRDGFFGWAAYTRSRALRKDGPGAGWRRFDFDQPHALTAVLGWSQPQGWEVSGRLRYATGAPRTPVVGAVYDLTRDRHEPQFGARNSTRLPDFFQLDLRLGRAWGLEGAGSVAAYLEVTNATGRENVEEFVYSADYTQRGSIQGLPLLPVVGVQWDF